MGADPEVLNVSPILPMWCKFIIHFKIPCTIFFSLFDFGTWGVEQYTVNNPTACNLEVYGKNRLIIFYVF